MSFLDLRTRASARLAVKPNPDHPAWQIEGDHRDNIPRHRYHDATIQKRTSPMKRLFACTFLALAVAGFANAEESTFEETNQCTQDIDCQGDLICKNGLCDLPQPQQSPVAKTTTTQKAAPSAPPGVAYQALPINTERAGPFTTQPQGTGTALNYRSRAGVINVMESVVEQAEYTGYVTIERAFTFGPSRYVVVVSTGEGGNACPASTYVLSFDTEAERVDGKQEVKGCSERVEVEAQGNKLLVKKEDGEVTVYNGVVQ
ncbi:MULTISPECIES: hypothetical protein [Pseudomonas]|uniref:hypothetical protein n=2 Tax=Pseudomonas TaxID=286 RepID=UPI0015A6D18A|nr:MULTISPECIES: hypothetical protein [Pseudomonas]MDT8906012.1 hypothetical protein [Pseudomonas prosekii]